MAHRERRRRASCLAGSRRQRLEGQGLVSRAQAEGGGSRREGRRDLSDDDDGGGPEAVSW